MKNTHLVLKLQDLRILHPSVNHDLEYICGIIQHYRARQGKNPVPRYIVVNMDEPYTDEIVAVLKKHGHWEEDNNEPT